MNLLINGDYVDHLTTIKKKSVDLILTDPPYGISKKSYFKNGKAQNDRFNRLDHDFGYWDESPNLSIMFSLFKKVIRKGGTLIMFYDIWKSSDLLENALQYGFSQPRICTWIKNNPVPINSDKNYLSNSSEFFFSFVRVKSPTFNSKYDKGIYNYPLCHGRERFDHPTQKPLDLIEDLVKKHSKEGDLVLDPFAGTFTTAEACKKNNRNFICIEKDIRYYHMGLDRMEKYQII